MFKSTWLTEGSWRKIVLGTSTAKVTLDFGVDLCSTLLDKLSLVGARIGFLVSRLA